VGWFREIQYTSAKIARYPTQTPLPVGKVWRLTAVVRTMSLGSHTHPPSWRMTHRESLQRCALAAVSLDGRWRRPLTAYSSAIFRSACLPETHPTNMATTTPLPHALVVCMILVVMTTPRTTVSGPMAVAAGDVSFRLSGGDGRWAPSSHRAQKSIYIVSVTSIHGRVRTLWGWRGDNALWRI